MNPELEIYHLEKRVLQLEIALHAFWTEMCNSGNSDAKDYGWPDCTRLYRECFPDAKAGELGA